MAETKRRYCWRTGLVLPLADGEKCGECGRADHRIHEGDTCGRFVEASPEHGEPCALPIGHAGRCSLKEAPDAGT